jgi:hypothetical protein
MDPREGDPVLMHLAGLREPELPAALRARVQAACLPVAAVIPQPRPRRRRLLPMALAASAALAAVALGLGWERSTPGASLPDPGMAGSVDPVGGGPVRSTPSADAIEEIRAIDRQISRMLETNADPEAVEALWARRAVWVRVGASESATTRPRMI